MEARSVRRLRCGSGVLGRSLGEGRQDRAWLSSWREPSGLLELRVARRGFGIAAEERVAADAAGGRSVDYAGQRDPAICNRRVPSGGAAEP